MDTNQQNVYDVYSNGDRLIGSHGLKIIHQMRRENKLDEIDALLSKAVVSPAVANEYRLNCVERAKNAKKKGEWHMVVAYLEAYNQYADSAHDLCVSTVNQEPPTHTERDQKLLAEAKEKATSSIPQVSIIPIVKSKLAKVKALTDEEFKAQIRKILNE